MIVTGVDPGSSGGLVWLIEGEPLLRVPMPLLRIQAGKSKKSDLDEVTFCRLLEEYRPDHLFYEHQHAMPGQGVVSMFSVGKGYMMIRTAVAALKIPSTEVPARRWQNAMMYGQAGEDTKVRALLVAQRIWPDADWRATERSRVPHDGIVDAALIAEWGRRSLEGGWQTPPVLAPRRKGKTP